MCIEYNNLIGLLDGIIGYDYWMIVFHPNSDVAVYYSSQGRFFVLYVIFSKIVKIIINGTKK